MEAELESEEPTKMGDDVSASEDEEDRGAIVTLVEHREPTVVPVGGGRGTETRGDIPKSWKRTASEDTTVE